VSDGRRREFERQAAQGDLQAGARGLLERSRAGDLDPGRLRLAAYLGDPAAQGALATDCPDVPSDLVDWVAGMRVFDLTVPVRAAVAAAWPAVHRWEEEFVDARPVPQPRDALEAIETWLECPCGVHALQVYESRQRPGARRRGQPPLSVAALEELERAAEAGDVGAAVESLVEQVRRGTRHQVHNLGDAVTGLASQMLRATVCAPADHIANGMDRATPCAGHMGRSVRDAGRVLGEDAVRAVIRDQLVPWALGSSGVCSPWQFEAVTASLVRDDIARRRVDAIANAANDQLLMQGGVAAALRVVGGQEIERQAVAQAPAPLGSVVRTEAGSLAARYVYHAVVIRYSLAGGTRASDVHAAVGELIRQVGADRLSTLALPLFGAGVGGLGVGESMETVLDALEGLGTDWSWRRVHVEVVVLDPQDYEEAQRAWRAFLPRARRDAEASQAAEAYLRLLTEGEARIDRVDP
jgi:O-acetyl-ADP-ribose deacetylase